MLTKFTYDGSTDFVLSGTGVGVDAVCNAVLYFPQTPVFDMSITDEIERMETATVTEGIELLLTGTSANIKSAVNTIEDIFIKAQRQIYSISDDVVYIEYQTYTGQTTYRSQILDGRLEWSTEPALRTLPSSGNTTVKVFLFITRKAYWEGSEVSLAISNTASGGATTTSGRNIYNYNGSNGNYVNIASTQITGRLPAPIKLKLINNTGSVQSYKHIHVGVSAFSDYTLSHQLEGENCYALSDGSTVSSGTSSGGYVRRYTDIGTTIKRLSYNLNAAFMQKTKGRYFRILARVPTSGTGVYAKITLRSGSDTGTILAESGEVLLSGTYNIKDLGMLPFPSGGYDAAMDETWLVVEMTAATTQTVEIDFLNLFPVDSYRCIVQRGETIDANDFIIDDQINIPKKIYVQDSATGNRKYIFTSFGKSYLFPNKNTKVQFLWDGASVTYNSTFTVLVYFRPRVVTI